MTRLREAPRYTNPGHPFDGAPLEAVGRISKLSKDGGVRFQYFSDDFLQYPGPNTAGEAGGWLLTETAAGGGNAQRVDVDDSVQFGVLKLLTDNADNDTEILQLVGEPWRYVKGKRLWFGARVALQVANDGECFFGLAITDLSPVASLPSDGLFFEKAETAVKMDFHARKGGTSTEKTSVDKSNMADATYHEYAVYVDELGNVHVFYDGDEVASIAASDANLPNTEDLTLILAYQTGAAAAQSMLVDWVLIAQER